MIPPYIVIGRFDSKGIFFIKNAYSLAFSDIVHTLPRPASPVWKSLWSTKVPVRPNLYLDSLHGILPTQERLNYKHDQVTLNCIFRSSIEETIFHLGCECSWAEIEIEYYVQGRELHMPLRFSVVSFSVCS